MKNLKKKIVLVQIQIAVLDCLLLIFFWLYLIIFSQSFCSSVSAVPFLPQQLFPKKNPNLRKLHVCVYQKNINFTKEK